MTPLTASSPVNFDVVLMKRRYWDSTDEDDDLWNWDLQWSGVSFIPKGMVRGVQRLGGLSA